MSEEPSISNIATGLRNRVSLILSWALKIGTPIYLIGFGFYINKKWGKISGLDPNALGDLLAGAFGPLAFAWLVLGYFQQGEELRKSNEAFEAQTKQLKETVEQQRALVEASQKQLEYHEGIARETQRQVRNQEFETRRRHLKDAQAERIAYQAKQPIFKIEIETSGLNEHAYWKLNLSIRNVGAPCVLEFLEFESQSYKLIHNKISYERLSPGDYFPLYITAHREKLNENVSLVLRYFDADGSSTVACYELKFTATGCESPRLAFKKIERSDIVIT
ncbi:hypothetical protein EC845_0126 [Comamonas sp. BIGb0124]|uniref:hypothetical protein n=1 Tax=Comamonas sp. BIGb0124 TaxID=2485130 RepID=UPI000F9B30B5|nr:hypothetical protein [Comamonas sp. BIGb0124]ROR26566.1 hypothetical protein EC845_0126 [Comamonas sp. BIGb0124]